jgi:hypothetical protein
MVAAFRCCFLLGYIILEVFDSVCMLVVVGWLECLHSSSWHRVLLFLFKRFHVSSVSSVGCDPRVLGVWLVALFLPPPFSSSRVLWSSLGSLTRSCFADISYVILDFFRLWPFLLLRSLSLVRLSFSFTLVCISALFSGFS